MSTTHLIKASNTSAQIEQRGSDAGAAWSQLHDGAAVVGRFNGLDVRPARTQGDAYGRILVAAPRRLFGTRFLYGLNLSDIGSISAGGGTLTWNSTKRAASLNITGASGDRIIVASHRVILTNSGRSGEIAHYFQFGASHANNRYEVFIGSTDGAYGNGLREQGGVISLVVRNAGIPITGEAIIPQSSWNVDKLDGLGPSGITLTTLNTTLHCLVGRGGGGDSAFFSVLTIDGLPVHSIGPIPGNLGTPGTVWRVQAEAKNVGVGVPGALLFRAFNNDVMGAGDDELHPETVTRPALLNVSTAEVPLMSIKPTATVGGVANDTSLFPMSFVPIFPNAGDCEFYAYYQTGGADPLGGTGTWVPDPGAPFEANVTATSWTPNANTRPVGFTGTARGGAPIDLTQIFGDGTRDALRVLFGTGYLEQLHITAKLRAASQMLNGQLTFGVQSKI